VIIKKLIILIIQSVFIIFLCPFVKKYFNRSERKVFNRVPGGLEIPLLLQFVCCDLFNGKLKLTLNFEFHVKMVENMKV
jgi:hypothetical protein